MGLCFLGVNLKPCTANRVGLGLDLICLLNSYQNRLEEQERAYTEWEKLWMLLLSLGKGLVCTSESALKVFKTDSPPDVVPVVALFGKPERAQSGLVFLKRMACLACSDQMRVLVRAWWCAVQDGSCVVQEGINIILRGLAPWWLCQKAGGGKKRLFNVSF